MTNNKFKDAVLDYFKKYYKRHKKAPSTRQIFKVKHFSKTKFYQTFPNGLAEACKLAGIPVPEASIKRMKRALQASEKKRVREIEKEATPVQDVKQSYEIQHEVQQREEQRRKELAEKHAKEDAMLLQDPNEAIRRPVVNAIENYALPVLLEIKYGIKATVPEILAMLKLYQKAKDEGWYVEDVMEWAVLSGEEQADVKQLCKEAHEKGLSVRGYRSMCKGEVEDLEAKSGHLSRKNERLSRTVEGLKREEEDLNRRCSRLNRWLTEDYQSKEKRLEEKYLRDIDGCKVGFLKFKGKVQAMKKELIDDYKGWETKCYNLVEAVDKIKAETAETVKERDTARGELKQLRVFVGPRGTVADLVKQKEDLKATLTDKDQQLAEMALWLSRDFNARMEAERMVTEERENTLLLAEHLIEKAGDLPHLFLLLSDPQHFPKEHFKELNSLMDELQVWRGYENPPNLYKGILSKSKAPLNHIKTDIEKYME